MKDRRDSTPPDVLCLDSAAVGDWVEQQLTWPVALEIEPVEPQRGPGERDRFTLAAQREAADRAQDRAIRSWTAVEHLQRASTDSGHGHTHVSRTHSEGWAAVVVASRYVGLDIQRLRPVSERAERFFCQPHERSEILLGGDREGQVPNSWGRSEAHGDDRLGDIRPHAGRLGSWPDSEWSGGRWRDAELIRIWTVKEAVFKAVPANTGLVITAISIAQPASLRTIATVDGRVGHYLVASVPVAEPAAAATERASSDVEREGPAHPAHGFWGWLTIAIAAEM